MTAYYNEIDPYAAQWLRNLISAGHIAPGEVDERSIEDVTPDDIRSYTQCHFFAGIGVWSYALRNAGWPDDRPVWTGSCPCQPFSAAGKGGGFADERHLWPAFHWLIAQRRPDVVFGEQVASSDGLQWLDLVSSDLEASGYAVGAVDTCTAGVGGPHIRQRLRFVAQRLDHSTGARRFGQTGNAEGDPRDEARLRLSCAGSEGGGLADADKGQRGRLPDGEGRFPNGAQTGRQQGDGELERDRAVGRVGVALDARLEGQPRYGDDGHEPGRIDARAAGPVTPASPACGTRPVNGVWRNADWLFCRDGKWRPVEPGTFPLAHGAPSRVGRLRAYGNAVDAEATRVFIEAAIPPLAR